MKKLITLSAIFVVVLGLVLLRVLSVNKIYSKDEAYNAAKQYQSSISANGQLIKNEVAESCSQAGTNDVRVCSYNLTKIYRAPKTDTESINTLTASLFEKGFTSNDSFETKKKDTKPYKIDLTDIMNRQGAYSVSFHIKNGLLNLTVLTNPDPYQDISDRNILSFTKTNTDSKVYYLYGLVLTFDYNDNNSHWDKIRTNPFSFLNVNYAVLTQLYLLK